MRFLYSTLALLLLSMTACGDGSSPTTPTSPTPTPAPVTTVALQGAIPSMEPRVLFTAGSFTTSAIGGVEILVDWTFATNNLDVYLARGTCSIDQVNAGTCSYAVFSESTTAKPERLRLPDLAAGSYSLLIGNRGPTAESASYQVLVIR